MAKQVSASIQVDAPLKNTGVIFTVYETKQKDPGDYATLGRLEVSKAKLKWTHKNGKKPDGEATWEDFIAWITDPNR